MALIFLEQTNSSHFYYFSQSQDYLVPIAGLITALPLLWMVLGTKLLSLSNAGVLFYLNPGLQFLIAIFVFHEPINQIILSSFIFVWLATIIYFIKPQRESHEPSV